MNLTTARTAGTIGAVGNNGLGSVGVARVKLMGCGGFRPAELGIPLRRH